MVRRSMTDSRRSMDDDSRRSSNFYFLIYHVYISFDANNIQFGDLHQRLSDHETETLSFDS